MKINHGTKLSGAFLCVLLACAAILAQKKSEYRTGHLIKVENDTDLLDQSHKASYLLYIHDGSDEVVASYSMTYFSHDRSSLLKPDTDVSYRISGKNLFVVASDGKEIKAHLCHRDEKHGNLLVC